MTERQLRILILIANGKSTKEIAKELELAFKAVVTHRHNVNQKLGLNEGADLTRAAIQVLRVLTCSDTGSMGTKLTPNPNRQALEELWRRRLSDARLRLDFAQNYMREVQNDRGAKDIPAPDWSFAFEKALRAENFALAEYRYLLRIVTDLVVNGIIPDDNEWRRQKPVRRGMAGAAN